MAVSILYSLCLCTMLYQASHILHLEFFFIALRPCQLDTLWAPWSTLDTLGHRFQNVSLTESFAQGLSGWKTYIGKWDRKWGNTQQLPSVHFSTPTKLQGSLEGCSRSSPQAPQTEPAQGFRLSVLPPSSDSHFSLLQIAPKSRAGVRVLVLQCAFGGQDKPKHSLHVGYIVKSHCGNTMQVGESRCG